MQIPGQVEEADTPTIDQLAKNQNTLNSNL